MSANPPSPDPKRWWALFLLCAAQFLVILDTSIVGIALPALQRALGFDAAGLQWIFNAYVVAFGGLLLLGGRLADLHGPRRLFAIGFGVLTASSLVAGLATTGALLLAGRALQGAGAALIAPAALSMVMALFAARPDELRRALGFWGASAAAGGTAGVFLGGVITEWLSWRWTFLVNVPVGLLVLLAVRAWLPRGERQPGSVDVLGALSITGGLGLVVYAIVTANVASSATTVLLLGISVVLFAAFAVIQRVRNTPLVPGAILRAPNLTVGNIVMALLGAAWIPAWFFLNIYLQEVLGFGAFESGLALLPMTLAIMLLMVFATEKVVGRIGPKSALVIGLGFLGLALLLFARMPANGSFAAHVLFPSLLGAVGMSLAYIPAMITATAGARPEDAGVASGLVNTTYQVGSAIGLAAMVAVASTGGYKAAFVGAGIIAAGAAVLSAFAVRGPSKRGLVEKVAAVAGLLALAMCDAAPTDTTGETSKVPAAEHARTIDALEPPRRARPVVAVIAANDGTETTDFVVPYAVLAKSGAADVFAVAPEDRTIKLVPALAIKPHMTIAAFDARFPDGADYVIVPKIEATADPTIVRWIQAQSVKGTTIVGICSGVKTVGAAGLLDGRASTGHWFDIDGLRTAHPTMMWVQDRRYVVDRGVMTTTGVSASLPASLALVEAIAGRQVAGSVAADLGVSSWSEDHDSLAFSLTPTMKLTAQRNRAIGATTPDVLVMPVADEVDDIALAFTTDAWSRTFRSKALTRAEVAGPLRTRYGLELVPDTIAAIPGAVELPAPVREDAGQALPATLDAIARRYDPETAAFVALQLEYAWK
jgi:EmrB/QacA subfamily drug resistance transporter